MNRRQLIQALLALLGTSLGLSGCARATPVTVGIHPWPGYEPLLLARDFGWLGEAVVLHEGSNAGDSIAGLKDGKLNAACLTLDEVLSVRASGVPLTVILITNESVGADVVLARPDIRTPAELKGRRIAVEQGALGSLVLQKLLAAGGMTAADIDLVDAPPSAQRALWQAGKIDAAISYPPFAAQLIGEGAVRIFDSRQFPHTVFDTLAVRRDRLAQLDSALHALINGHLRALEHLRASREDALRRIAARRGLSFEEAEATYRGLHLPALSDNRRLLMPDGGLLAAARSLSQLMHASGLLAVPDTLTGLVNANYLPRGN